MQRITKQRKIILEEMRSLKTHPNASELYVLVRKKLQNVSLGTVYRNLELMSREGTVMKIDCDDFARYDGRRPEPHPHFICDGCQRVYDFEEPIALTFNKEGYEKQTGAKIQSTSIELRGLCGGCR